MSRITAAKLARLRVFKGRNGELSQKVAMVMPPVQNQTAKCSVCGREKVITPGQIVYCKHKD